MGGKGSGGWNKGLPKEQQPAYGVRWNINSKRRLGFKELKIR